MTKKNKCEMHRTPRIYYIYILYSPNYTSKAPISSSTDDIL